MRVVIDLHCHILPGIDDGPATLAGSIELARAAALDGTRTVVATPHVRDEHRSYTRLIPRLVDELNAALVRERIELEIRAGAELSLAHIRDIAPPLLSRLTLGGGRWLLFESPHGEDVDGLERELDDLLASGYRVMLTNPERCVAFQRDRAMLERVVAAGVLSSVAAGSLDGRHGEAVRRIALELIADSLAHNVASDAHDDHERAPTIAGELQRAGLQPLAQWLTHGVPAAILAGGDIPARPVLSGATAPRRRRSGRAGADVSAAAAAPPTDAAPPPTDAAPASTAAAPPPPAEIGAHGGGTSLDAYAIATRTARGGLLLAGRSGIVQVLQLGSSVLIARLIVPEAYGALTVALAALGFARYVGDLGVSTSFLPLAELHRRRFQTGALISLTMALLEAAGLVALAPLLARALHGPSYSSEMIRLLALCIVFESLRFGPNVKLSRELRFGRAGALSLAETLLLYVSQISLLVLGAGIWALVAGQLIRSVLGTLLFIWKGGGLTLPAYRQAIGPIVRRALPYQGPLVIAAAGGLLLPLALTAALSDRQIGLWGWATVLATPIATVVGIVSAITLPGLARLRANDPAIVERAAAIMVRASMLVPAVGAGALCGFARPLVAYVFGSRWHGALSAAEIDLLGVIPTTLSVFLAAVLESDQRASARFVAIIVAQVAGLAVVVPLSHRFGVSGAAFVSAVAIPLVDVLVLGWMSRLDYRRAALNGVVGFAAAAGVAFLLSHLATSLPLLLACVAAAGLPALAIGWLTDRSAVAAVVRYGVNVPPWLSALVARDAV
jgi:protein-tyrosine phosphatase